MAMPQKELVRCLKALANERRVRILLELSRDAPLDVEALAHRIRLSYKSTAKHVAQLERCDFLMRMQLGPWAQYRLNRTHVLLRVILSHARES